MGTLDGLSIIDPQTYQCTSYQYDANDPESINQNSIHSVYKDRDGSMWIGTFYGGVNIVYNPNVSAPLVEHQYTVPQISNNIISSIAIDEKNNLYIGTEGGGLNYLDRLTNKISTFVNQPGNAGSLSSNLVKKILIDKDKNVWIGTHGGGLNLFNRNDHTFRQVLTNLPFLSYRQSEIVALQEDSKNIFWLGAHAGLYAFKRTNTLLTPLLENELKPLRSVNISALLEDKNKNIWIGSLTGLYFFNRQTERISSIAVKHHIKNINCITEDSEGNIWIGLSHGGLATYDRSANAVVPVTLNNNLSNKNILGILEDSQNNLWISTGNGLVKYNFNDGSVRMYTKSDGLPGNEFNYNAFFKDKTGEMFFGGMSGLVSLFPDKIKNNKFAAPVVFTGLKVLNAGDESGILQNDIDYVDRVELKHNQNTFTINFALLSYIKSNKNIFGYKLRGVHTDLIRTNIPSATFTNLAPGSYTLEINGANNDGVWSYPRLLKIKILPPFWATWWAYLFYILLASTILFFIFRFFYLRALLARDHELHELKLNFFTNISHEIRTHLTLIQAPVERMESENKQNPGLLRQLAHLKNNTNRLLHLVSELMDFRKAETDSMKLHIAGHDLISFLSSIYETFEDLAQSKNINISFVHDKKEALLYFDSEQMEKVFYNLLTNAFKFTPHGGRVEVYVEDQENKILIHITDNGKGIAPQYIGKLFTNFFQVDDHTSQNTGYGIGLALSKAIVNLHKGAITVTSTPSAPEQEGRTRFTVTLLKGYDHFASEVVSKDNEEHRASVRETEPEKEDTGYAENIPEKQVLVVEDNESIRELIRETLENYYSVTLCEDGLTGWEAATKIIPDLVISDVMMPGMEGTLLAQKLRADERTSHIPVILLTAKSTQADQIEGLSKGADVYLTKPFSVEVLRLSVKNLLTSREKMRKKFSKEFTIAPKNIVIQSADEEFLNKLIGITEEELDEPGFGVERLASKVAMSQSVLYKKLRAVTDMSVNEFIKSIRLKKAAQLLISKQYNVSEVSLMVGFYDRKYFSKEFKKEFGVTPSEYAQLPVEK